LHVLLEPISSDITIAPSEGFLRVFILLAMRGELWHQYGCLGVVGVERKRYLRLRHPLRPRLLDLLFIEARIFG